VRRPGLAQIPAARGQAPPLQAVGSGVGQASPVAYSAQRCARAGRAEMGLSDGPGPGLDRAHRGVRDGSGRVAPRAGNCCWRQRRLQCTLQMRCTWFLLTRRRLLPPRAGGAARSGQAGAAVGTVWPARQARDLLVGIYAWFTEGFDTATWPRPGCSWRRLADQFHPPWLERWLWPAARSCIIKSG